MSKSTSEPGVGTADDSSRDDTFRVFCESDARSLKGEGSQHHPPLRIVVSNDDFPSRKYAQSTSGRSSSQDTRPPDSRSIAIASSVPQGRVPYATLCRWPAEMRQRSAKAERSERVIDFRKALRSTPKYHHTVIDHATPIGAFTKWGASVEDAAVPNSSETDVVLIRRANLRKVLELHFGGNQSSLARLYNPKNPRANYFSDLLRGEKSFGEKAARRIEAAARLIHGQLDIPDSPLLVDNSSRSPVKDELEATVADMTQEELHHLLEAARRIRAKRALRRKAS